MTVALYGVQIENLRGFRSALLAVEQSVVLLVGPNNSGKTSLLRLLDWALNAADKTVLTGGRPLNGGECDLFIPARDTRGGARRLTCLSKFRTGVAISASTQRMG